MFETRWQRLLRRFEWPMAVLALLIIPVLVIEERATTPELRGVAVVINWVIWIAFVVEFAVGWAAARTWAFPRRAWFDLLLILVTPPFGVPEAMQGVRSVRVLRVLRLLRAVGVAVMGVRLAQRHLAKKKFHYVLLIACGTVVLGAVAVYALEAHENRNIRHFGDALWWAITTVTTVGYGDITPITPEGRLVAVALMLTGISVISVFTATVASLLFEEQQTLKSGDGGSPAPPRTHRETASQPRQALRTGGCVRNQRACEPPFGFLWPPTQVRQSSPQTPGLSGWLEQ